MACNVLSSIKIEFGNLIRKIEKLFIELEGEITPSAFSKIREESVNYLKLVKQKALDLGYSFTDDDLIEISRFINMRINKSGCPKLADNVILGLILNPESTDNFITDTVVSTSSLDEVILNKREYKRDFIDKIYQGAEYVKELALNTINYNFASTLLFDRDKGRITRNVNDLNNNIKELQNDLLKIVFNFLKNYYSDSKNRLSDVDYYDIYNNDTITMYDINGNYTGNFENIYKSAFNVFNTYDNFKLNFLFLKKDEGLKAFNAFLTLLHFDEFLINSFGDLIKINNMNIRFTSENKYSIESKATNMFWSNSKDDDIDLSKSVNNISKLIIGTTRMYNYTTGNIIPDTYLTFNHFSDVITKLKDLALNKKVSESIYLNQKDSYGIPTFNLNVLSAESRNFIKKLGNNATFANLLNRTRENSYEAFSALFELLTSKDEKNIKALKTITNLFNIEERNAIMSIGKELFNKNESKSLRSILDNQGYDPNPNKNVNYFGYILQTADTSGIVKNCQYGYNLEELKNMLQSLYNSNIQSEKRFIKDSINILNSPIVNNLDIDLESDYSNRVFKFKFNYNGQILTASVTNNNVFTINGTNLDTFISQKLLENRDLAVSEFLKFIDNFIHQDFLNNRKYFDNLLLVYLDTKGENEVLTISNLMKFSIKLLHGLFAVRKINEELSKISDIDDKESLIKTIAVKYTNEEPKVVFDYGTIDIIPKTLGDVIDYIAIAKSLTEGSAVSSLVNDASGNSISNSTPSRLLSNFTILFDEIVKDKECPANHFDLINDKNVLIDILTVREFVSLGENKIYNQFNTREFMEASLLIDFLGMFNNVLNSDNYNLLKNKSIGVTPTVNSDKNTISKMVLNSAKILSNICGENISIQDFLKNYEQNRDKLIKYINKELGSYYNKLNTLLENDLIKLSSSSRFFLLVTDNLVLNYNYDSFELFNNKLLEFNSRFKLGLFNTQFLDTNLVEFEEAFIPWKDDPTKTKKVLNIYLKGLRNKGYFLLVADTDFDNTLYNGEYSVHFKTVNEKGEGYSENTEPSTKDERAILYKELIKAIPYGAVVSTWGEISDGGLIALSKVAKGWRQVGKRNILDKNGNPIKIGKFKKPLLNTRQLFNIASRESGIDIKDLLHAVFSPNEIKLNNSIKLALSRYNNRNIDLEYYKLKNSELVQYLVNNKVTIDLVNNEHVLNFLLDNGLQNWISDSGTLIFAKYLMSNGGIIDIKSESDFKLISQLDPVIRESLNASNSELKYSPHLLSDNLTINPVVETWNMMNYLYSLEYLIGTVGSHVNHPNKKSVKSPKDLIEYINDEAARFLALHKRNVSQTAAMHEFLLNQIDGIPTFYNIATIEDINDLVYNLAGDLSEAKPFDGSTIVNPFIVYLENYSLKGEKAGIHKKLFVHFYDTRTGTGGIIKTAGFGITNSWMKNSPFLLRIMKNMTDILWTDKAGNPIYVDITKKYLDKPLSSTNLMCYDIYYTEPINTPTGWSNKYYKIKNIEYKGNGTYELTRIEVTNKGFEKVGTELKETFEGINSNYKVWKYIFKGLNSVGFNKNGTLSGKGYNGETSIANTVLAINSCGFGEMITLESYYLPMKHSDTHYLVTEGAIKLGAANFNTKDGYYKDEVYHRFKIKMLLAGIQLDKEHHADNSEISMMTLVVSACAALGYTWNESNRIYKALRTLTEIGIENLTKPLREVLKVNSLENRRQFNKVVADLIVKSLKNSSNSKDGVIYNITYNLIEKYRNGETITDLDLENNPIPISDPVLFNKVQSLISSYLTSSAIKMKFRGILSVLVPSHEIMKLYGDRLYSSFTNPQEEIKELLKIYDSKFLNISDIEIGKTYKIINPATGRVEDRVHIQAPFMKEKHKNNVYGDPSLIYTDYYDLREQFNDEYKDCVLVEDITNGRNLGAYFCTFEGVKGDTVEKYNFYDLIESKQLYKGTIDGKIGRKLLQERLANLKNGSTVIVDINGVKSEVVVRNLNIKPYEVIMPKIFATLLGLTEDDDLFALKDDKNSFKKKILDNISNKIYNEEAFTVALKRLNGDHMYILSKEQFDKYGLHDLIEVTVDPPVKDLSSNDVYRESNGEYLYSMSSLNDKIYQIDGKEVIVTDNVDFYIENQDYNLLYVSSKVSNKLFTNILGNKTIKNKAFKNWKKLVTSSDLFFKNENGELEEKPLTIVDIKNKNRQLNNLRFNNSTKTILSEGIDIDNNLSDFINTLGDELYTSFIKSLDLIAARIPAQSMLSFMPMKVVGYEDFDINTAYVCTHQIWLLGSDYDIDAVSLLTFELSKNGLFVGWSPYFNYSSIDHLSIACGLELPTGKDIELINERDLFTNISSKEDLLERLTDYVTELFSPFLIQRTNNEIQLIDKSDDLITYLQKVNVINKLVTLGILNIENSSEVLKNDILNIYNQQFSDMKIKDTNELVTIFKLLEKIVNEHNNYINTSRDIKSMVKNFIVLNIYNISMSLSNLILALMSVDQTTDEPKSIANNSEKGKLLKNATPGNIGNVFLSIEDNHVGKDVIGISAVGLKSFFAITLYINTILNDPKNSSETILKLLYQPLIFNGKEYVTIANANLRNNENARVNLLILNKLMENNDHDAALLISALLSLATDNAKELCLSKLNANARMAGMYIYGLTMGVPFQDLGKLLMSDIGDMVAQYLKGSIITDNLKLNSVDSVLKFLNNPVSTIAKIYKGTSLYNKENLKSSDKVWYEIKSDVNKIVLLLKENNDIFDSYYDELTNDNKKRFDFENYLKLIVSDINDNNIDNDRKLELIDSTIQMLYKVKQVAFKLPYKNKNGKIVRYSQLNYYLKNRAIDDLIEGFNSMYKIKLSESKLWDGAFVDFISLHLGASELNIIGNLLGANLGVKNKYEDFLTFVNNFESVISKRKKIKDTYSKYYNDKSDEEVNAELDFNKFIIDENYRNEKIQEYDKIAFSFNPLRIITTVPLYKGYIDSVGVKHGVLLTDSIKYRTMYSHLNKINNIIGYMDLSSKISSLDNLISYKLVNLYFAENNKYFIIPLGSKIITLTSETESTESEATIPTKIFLGTLGGNATFKKWMELEVIPNLKLGYTSSNKKIKLPSIANNEFIKSLIPRKFTKNPNKLPSTSYSSNVNMSPRTEEGIAILDRLRLSFDLISNSYTMLDENGNKVNIPIKDLFYWYDLIAYNGKQRKGSLTKIFDNYATTSESLRLKLFTKKIDDSDLIYHLSDEEIIKWGALVENPYSSFSKWIYYKDTKNLTMLLLEQDTSEDSYDSPDRIGNYIKSENVKFDTNYILHRPVDVDNVLYKTSNNVSVTYNPVTRMISLIKSDEVNSELLKTIVDKLNESNLCVAYDPNTGKYSPKLDLIDNIIEQLLCKK